MPPACQPKFEQNCRSVAHGLHGSRKPCALTRGLRRVYSMAVMRWGLVLQHDLGRAAQYARLLELMRVPTTVAHTTDEAAFHVSRLGAPAVLLIELTMPAEREVRFLRELKRATPVIAIVDSRQMYEFAARQMIDLNIVSLLTRSQHLITVDRAIRQVVGAEAPHPPAAPAPQKPPPDEYFQALRVAERLSDHPLVERLAKLPALEQGAAPEDLQRLAAETAALFAAPLALLWLDWSGRSSFVSHPRLAPDATLRQGGGPWLAFRNALAGQPLHAADVFNHRLMANNPLVRDHTLRSFAGAPIRSTEGAVVGAICIGHPAPNGIAAGHLDPLVFWALRIGSSLAQQQPAAPSLPPPPPEITAPPPETTEKAPSPLSARGVLMALQTGVFVTDLEGAILHANPQAPALLGLGKKRLRGLSRRDVCALLRSQTDASAAALAELSSAALGPQPHAVELVLTRPSRRVLRWETRAFDDGSFAGRIDEIVELTREAAARDELEKHVRIDPLTGLPNRRGGEEALGREIARCLRSGSQLSVALFEPDSIDVFQPAVADSVLRAAAWLLRDMLRGYDFAALYERRQLLAILPGATAEQTGTFAERYRAAVEKMPLDGLPRVTVSGGVAQFDPAQILDQLLAEATAALVEARRQGGNRVV